MNVSSDTSTASALYHEGREAAQSGDLVRAARLLERALEQSPDRADIGRDLARLMAGLGRYRDAVAYFEDALDGRPSANEHDHYDHGACLTQLGLHQRARAAYERALDLAPDWPLALDNLAVALQCLGHHDQAETIFRRVLHLAGSRAQDDGSATVDTVWTMRNLGSLLVQTDRVDEAIAVYREALEPAPDDPTTLHDLAKALHLVDDVPAAEDAYRAAIRAAPDNPVMRRHLGDLLLAAERVQDAEACYRESLSLIPDAPSAEALRGLGASLHLQKRFDEALLAFQGALSLAPDDPAYRYHHAVLLDHMGHGDAAMDAYRATLEVRPDHYEAQSSLASLLYRSRDFEAARDAYYKVLEIRPDDALARYLVSVLEREHLAIAPAEYVIQVFDTYAQDYDEHMVGVLEYNVPDEMRALFTTLRGPSPGVRYSLLDLGCGTGLVAAAFADVLDTAHGVDLAPEMVARSRERGIYRQVFQDDILAFLERTQTEVPSYDLIVLADVFVYIGDVSSIIATARARLAPDGLLMFSVESTDEDGYRVRRTGRFAHGAAYIARLARDHALTIEHAQPTVLRTECSAPVHGHIYALTPA